MAEQAPAFLEEIKQGGCNLHHVPTPTGDQPVIPPDVHVKTWDKQALLHDIAAGAPLRHVADIDDRSEPQIDPAVHVQQTNQHKELLTEVKAAAGHHAVVRELNAVSDAAGAGDGAEDAPVNPLVGQLHHVETADKSRPAIAADTQLHTWDKQGFLAEVAAPHQLRHVPGGDVHDASAPAIDPATHIGQAPQKAVLQQISGGALPALKHVEQQQQ